MAFLNRNSPKITAVPDKIKSDGKVKKFKTMSNFKLSVKESHKENGRMIIKTAADITEKFVPHLDTAIKLATYIMEIYDQAKYNKKICRVMADRVELAMASVKLLKRSIEDDFDRFQEKGFFEAFIHFIEILENIKSFIEEISGIKGFMEFIFANQIKSKFDEIREDFDNAYKALQLAISIDQIFSREKEDRMIKIALGELKDYYENIHKGMTGISEDYNLTKRKMSVLVSRIENLENSKNPLLNDIKPPQIDPRDISQPDSPEHHGSVLLRKYKYLNVACKQIKSPIDDDKPDSKKIRAILSIWNQLHDCPHIIKFYGISNLDIGNCMIFEWAELDNLKNVYEKTKLSWQTKLYIATDISRGIGFLHHIGILHHNMKAENILVTSGYKCKITNFDLSRGIQEQSRELTDIAEVVRWMAPEKIQSYCNQDKKVPYTYACEMFSFGMFLWELSFNRVPYKDIELEEIVPYVTSGKRETLKFEKGPSDIINGFTEIIKLAWQQDYRNRPSDPFVSRILESLTKTYSSEENSSMIIPDQNNHDSVKSLENDSDSDDLTLDDDDDDEFELLPLNKGIEIHKKPKGLKTKEDFRLSWECFNAHANLYGDKTAYYWKAYYYWNGYHVNQDRKEAVRLYKIAADAGHAEAQLRYAFAFIDNPDLPFDKNICLEYLNKSAENGNVTALFNLGDAYYRGKLKVPINKEKGLEYLKIAAFKDYPKAIERLEMIKEKQSKIRKD